LKEFSFLVGILIVGTPPARMDKGIGEGKKEFLAVFSGPKKSFWLSGKRVFGCEHKIW
jgi:hypothetical protein